MRKLELDDLDLYDGYDVKRAAYRARVMAHKQPRRLAVGPEMTWCFEDRLTIQYQVLEMLRIEHIFETPGMKAELDAYNPLIPDGSNLKVTMLIEIADPGRRRIQLALLRGVEFRCYLMVAGHAAVFAMADEDIARSNEEKTSSVHFLRFEFTPAMIADLRSGAALSAGVDHAAYRHRVDPVSPETHKALVADFE